MSCNRENVTWESGDGTWSIGFFDYYPINDDGDDWDYEWDVEYDFSRFMFASTGHPNEISAINAWNGANPGGGMTVTWRPETEDEIARYNKMAQAYKEGKLR